MAKLDERFADCAVVCGTQSVHYLKREDDTCIATVLNSPFTRDERLMTHRLMPVEKVAAGVATSPPLQTPPQQHNADIVGNFVLVRFETNRCSTKTYLGQCTETDGNELQVSFLTQCAYDICLPELHRSVLGGQRARRDSPHHTIT